MNIHDGTQYVIDDTDNDIGRIRLGRDICRSRKKVHLRSEEQRRMYKEKLRDGLINPLEFIQVIGHTIGKINEYTDLQQDTTSESEDEDGDSSENVCVVCLLPRLTTWIFMPCRHANCCADCSEQLEESRQPSPVCRSPIENSFQIFTN